MNERRENNKRQTYTYGWRIQQKIQDKQHKNN